ncbi:MAG: PEP/pyruvate-binding domain-containing protein, partial [Acidobacteriota bacterium]
MNEWKLPIGENTIRSRYVEFRTLLSLNNDCLEILASIQEDLHFIAAGREVPGERASGIFDKLGDLVGTLERVTGNRYRQLTAAVSLQRRELDAWVAVQSRQAPAPFVMRLDAVDRRSELLVGGKAAVLGEIRNRLLLPVPDGWVVTAEAYRRLFGTFLWKEVRDLTRRIDLDDLMRLEETSARLVQAVQQCPIPRVIAEAIDERVLHLVSPGGKLAVRSSAVGEGGRRTFAGQFRTVLQVDPEHAVDAWREVVASRFSATALSYRLSAGMPDVESPMAALFMPMLRTRAFGIVYTRDPGDRKSDVLWVTATGGVPGDSSSSTAELRVVSRSEPYREIESHIVPSGEPIAVHRDDGNSCCRADGPRTLNGEHLRQLAAWGCRIEQYLGCP